MTKRKKGHSNDTDQLWSRKFDDDVGYTNGNYSRIERKKADKAISPVLKSLWIFLALFIILPTGVFLWYSYNEQNNVEPPQTEKVVVKQSESKESSEQSEESPESEVSSASKDEESSEESSKESEESVESQASKEIETEVAIAEETVESQPTESSVSIESKPAESANTYTVKAGDNLYRIALDHGMTTEELKSLNGITGDTVAAGTILVVK